MLFGLFKCFKQSPGLPSYTIGPQYDGIGAGRFIFHPLTLPGVRYYGSGVIPQQSLRVLQHPQVYVNKTVPLAGLGGIQAGQIILSPLMPNGE